VRRFAPQLFAQLFCISLVLVCVSTAPAQLPTKRGIGQPQIRVPGWELGSLQRDRNTTFAREELVAQLALREDFRNLQIVENELMKRVFVHSDEKKPEITHNEIRSSLGKIKQLAKRLKLNLALPQREKEPVAYKVTLSPGLLLLDRAVTSFVENPLFQQPRVFDTELAFQAGNDLNEILRLTDFLRELTKEEQAKLQ
jgi:hypothetical protein